MKEKTIKLAFMVIYRTIIGIALGGVLGLVIDKKKIQNLKIENLILENELLEQRIEALEK